MEMGFLMVRARLAVSDKDARLVPRLRDQLQFNEHFRYLRADYADWWGTAQEPGNPQDTMFEFRVRFDGLSQAELELLLFAIEPSDAFHHKLGLGKPIGLGTVKVRVEAFNIVHRRVRYGPRGWDLPRSIAWSRAEALALRDSASHRLQERYPDAYRALRLIGESINLQDVKYPLTTQRAG